LIQPFEQALNKGRVFLLAGAGGGYDVLGCLPLYHRLTSLGHEVHLASLTFTPTESLRAAECSGTNRHLVRLSAESASERVYCPEAWLAAWLRSECDDSSGIWCFEKTGVRPLSRSYNELVERLGIDTVVLVDGGVDSLLRGDESSLGTPAEDLVSLAAVASLRLENPPLLACIGFGSEIRDGVCHAQALEAIAGLNRGGHFLGVSALLQQTEAGSFYQRGLEFVLSRQAAVRGSHVHYVVNSSVQGNFGPTRPETWVSPLASIYWFFDLLGVTQAHLFLDKLADTKGIWEVAAIIEGIRKFRPVRPATAIPL
jgi:hypothetical protein